MQTVFCHQRHWVQRRIDSRGLGKSILRKRQSMAIGIGDAARNQSFGYGWMRRQIRTGEAVWFAGINERPLVVGEVAAGDFTCTCDKPVGLHWP